MVYFINFLAIQLRFDHIDFNDIILLFIIILCTRIIYLFMYFVYLILLSSKCIGTYL